MKNTKLKNINLSTDMMDSEYIDSNFVHISGNEEIFGIKTHNDMISSKSNIVVDDTVYASHINAGSGCILCSLADNSSVFGLQNTVMSHCAAAVGYGNTVGANGYKIVDCGSVTDESLLSKGIISWMSVDVSDGKEKIDSRLSSISATYSINSPNGNTTSIGKIVKINEELNILYSNNVVHSVYTLNNNIYFDDYPYIGNLQIGTGQYSFSSGLYNKSFGKYSHTEGGYNFSGGSYAHTEGKKTTAGWGCHAEGTATRSLGEVNHSQGRLTKVSANEKASVYYSTSTGAATVVQPEGNDPIIASESHGSMARARNSRSFVWNGKQIKGYQGNPSKDYNIKNVGSWYIPGTTLVDSDDKAMECLDSEITLSDMYHDNGVGTFNINPEDGIFGFYIGEKSLGEYIQNETKKAVMDHDSLILDLNYGKSNTIIIDNKTNKPFNFNLGGYKKSDKVSNIYVGYGNGDYKMYPDEIKENISASYENGKYTLIIQNSITDISVQSNPLAISGYNSQTKLPWSSQSNKDFIQYALQASQDTSAITDISVGDSVLSISQFSFRFCPKLSSVWIGKGIKKLNPYQFSQAVYIATGDQGCQYINQIKNVHLGDNLIEIPDYCFHRNTVMSEIPEIPNNVSSIGAYAFCSCTKLSGALFIPKNVVKIGHAAYMYPSTSITALEFEDGCTITQIPENMIAHGESPISSIYIPSSVNRIGALAFANRKKLVTFSITGDVDSALEYVGGKAFSGCSVLSSVDFSKITSKYPSLDAANVFENTSPNLKIKINQTIADKILSDKPQHWMTLSSEGKIEII